MESNRSSQTIVLEFKTKTPGQATLISKQLPKGGEWKGGAKDYTI